MGKKNFDNMEDAFFDNKYTQEETEAVQPKTQKETTKQNKELIKPFKTIITIDDELLLDYFQIAKYIKMTTHKQYILDLIKADMKKTLKLSVNASDEEVLKMWKEYKKNLGK